MRLVNMGKITNFEEGSRQSSCSFPGVCVFPGGRLAASFKGSPEKGPLAGQHVYLCYSGDMGETWSAPAAPFPEGFEYNGRRGSFRALYLTHLGGERAIALMNVVYEEGDLPFFNTETEGLLDTDIFFAHSEDCGRTFGAPVRLDPPFDQPVPLTGPARRLPDGRLVCQFELNKRYYDPEPWVHSSAVTFSNDDGHSWGGASIITKDPNIYYWDQRLAAMNDGRLLDFFWTFDRERAEYLNIFACDSVDGGKAWSPLWDTGLVGQPGDPADIGDGRVAAIHIDRTSAPRIVVRLSADGGQTFLPEGLTIYDSGLRKQEYAKSGMNDAWEEMGAFSVGHPNLVKLPSGDLYAFFYAGPRTDRTDIHWARIAV